VADLVEQERLHQLRRLAREHHAALGNGAHLSRQPQAAQGRKVVGRTAEGVGEVTDVGGGDVKIAQEIQGGLPPALTRKPRSGGRSRTKRLNVAGLSMPSCRYDSAIVTSYRSVTVTSDMAITRWGSCRERFAARRSGFPSQHRRVRVGEVGPSGTKRPGIKREGSTARPRAWRVWPLRRRTRGFSGAGLVVHAFFWAAVHAPDGPRSARSFQEIVPGPGRPGDKGRATSALARPLA
jgi:hypothetical protein